MCAEKGAYTIESGTLPPFSPKENEYNILTLYSEVYDKVILLIVCRHNI